MSTESAVATRNLSRIRQWAEERQGRPARVKESLRDGDSTLRIRFEGNTNGETPEEISWDEWFDIFRKSKLSFVYHEEPHNDEESRYFNLVINENQL